VPWSGGRVSLPAGGAAQANEVSRMKASTPSARPTRTPAKPAAIAQPAKTAARAVAKTAGKPASRAAPPAARPAPAAPAPAGAADGKPAARPRAAAKAAPAPARKVAATEVAPAVSSGPPASSNQPISSNQPSPAAEAAPKKAAPLKTAAANAVKTTTETEAPASPAAEETRAPAAAPPRPPAKAENFAEGDHVVYPTHGVGKVERIAIEEIAGHKLELIHITFEENRMTLRVPVAKARTAGLRKLATRKMFDEALAVLKGRARVKRTMWSRRAQEYEAKINSGDPIAIAEVVRDLHRNAGQPDQSFSERQIYEAAMDRLAAELAALDKTDKTAAAIKLAEFLKTV
jgi:CarD family transcriptional regulator